MVKVCTQLQYVKVDGFADFATGVLWTFLQTLSELKKLKKLDVRLWSKEDDVPPKGLCFPSLEYLALHNSFPLASFYEAIASFSMPRLQKLHVSPNGWTRPALTSLLNHNQLLKQLRLVFQVTQQGREIVQLLTSRVWTSFVYVELGASELEDTSFMDADQLQEAFPNAAIHLQRRNRCRLFYGYNILAESGVKCDHPPQLDTFHT
jgi:hypothetical protein